MKTNEVKSFAKINLALHVTGKLTNLHKIESIVKFIELHDTISIKKIKSNPISFSLRPTSSGLRSSEPRSCPFALET